MLDTCQLLSSTRVLDLGGPDSGGVGRIFADLGADVLVVETPGGAPHRVARPTVAGASVAFALNNATIGHAISLADKDWKKALKDCVHLKNGLNVAEGKVTYEAVARDLGYTYVNADTLLN